MKKVRLKTKKDMEGKVLDNRTDRWIVLWDDGTTSEVPSKLLEFISLKNQNGKN